MSFHLVNFSPVKSIKPRSHLSPKIKSPIKSYISSYYSRKSYKYFSFFSFQQALTHINSVFDKMLSFISKINSKKHNHNTKNKLSKEFNLMINPSSLLILINQLNVIQKKVNSISLELKKKVTLDETDFSVSTLETQTGTECNSSYDLKDAKTPTFSFTIQNNNDNFLSLEKNYFSLETSMNSIQNENDNINNSTIFCRSNIKTKVLLSAVKEMNEKEIITKKERKFLKEKIITKDKHFYTVMNNSSNLNQNEIIRNLRRFLKGFK